MRSTHIVQSPEWGRFKTEYGTKAVRAGNVQYTIHKIPFTGNAYAYCPKVNPFDIQWDRLEASLRDNSCIAINFDVPNVLKGSEDENRAVEILEAKCDKSPKDTFAKFNILLDLTKSEDEILAGMHRKHRYNLKYAQKNGVTVKEGNTLEDFETFFAIFKKTAERQKYLTHPKIYYQKIWEMLYPLGMCKIVTAEHEGTPLASWMFFVYENILYYPYGGSSTEKQNLFPSTLVGWEGIHLGKRLGCNTFDMWGAAKDMNDTSDSWHGFTNFKMKFGGRHVEYIDSYDYILNKAAYSLFNTANDLRWKLLKILK